MDNVSVRCFRFNFDACLEPLRFLLLIVVSVLGLLHDDLLSLLYQHFDSRGAIDRLN